MDHFLSVFTATSIIVAIFSGLFIGYVAYGWLMKILENWMPTREPKRVDLKKGPITFLTLIFSLPFVLGFYVPQLTVAFVEGDLGWPRLLARSLVIFPYLIAYSVGLAFRLSRR